MARAEVRSTLSQPGPRRPASAGRLARTLGVTNAISGDMQLSNHHPSAIHNRMNNQIYRWPEYY
ncbi:hypothetical protein RA210_U510003 [Rubrivivax sp. A210]|nr:hypothetical protein RA210_U510003 [Rubrivivax sp. A210]